MGRDMSDPSGYSDDLRLAHPLETSEGKPGGFIIFCPACQQSHLFDLERWKFNGNFDSPTFTPSMLIYGNKSGKIRVHEGVTYGHRCHSFVTDGKIKFLSDCTHGMAGETVDLEKF